MGSKTHNTLRKAVVVHAGARDAYQLSLALAEAGLLDTLYTDLYWPAEWSLLNSIAKCSPAMHHMAMQRNAAGLPFDRVKLNLVHGVNCLLAERRRGISSETRRRAHRRSDAALGRAAGKRAARAHQGLVSYSYYGYDAMREFKRAALLFQVHPHPATVRRLLRQELQDHPECAESLCQEWELALPEDDYQHLVSETKMASRFLAASTFTRNSLIEHGADARKITVIPYGVDLDRFHPGPMVPSSPKGGKLKLLFVGRINQRKGVKYLLEALRLLDRNDVELTICGRVVDSLSLFQESKIQVTIRPSVSNEELVAAYQEADLFIFPSVAEGFGQVLLESLACGLPILSTTHTAAPDLIQDGEQGFIVEPRRPDLLAERIIWCLEHRDQLAGMKKSARNTAAQFTWGRFRTGVAEAVRTYLQEESFLD